MTSYILDQFAITGRWVVTLAVRSHDNYPFIVKVLGNLPDDKDTIKVDQHFKTLAEAQRVFNLIHVTHQVPDEVEHSKYRLY